LELADASCRPLNSRTRKKSQEAPRQEEADQRKREAEAIQPATTIVVADSLDALLAARYHDPDVLDVLREAVEGMQHAERYQAVERRWVGPVGSAWCGRRAVMASRRLHSLRRGTYDLSALTTREVIEPTLAEEEAREIFAAFKGRDQIHPAARSAQEAYERLRPPHPLLEFVHLVTQGRMLEDRQ
jgi:hypothetical protein